MYAKLIGILTLAVATQSVAAPACIVDAAPAAGGLLVVSYRSEPRQDAPVVPGPMRPQDLTERVGERSPLSATAVHPVSERSAPASAPREFAWAGDSATAIAAATGEAPFAPTPPAAVDTPRASEPAPSMDPESIPIEILLTPPLDVEMLKARLRNSDALGLFTKLELRNQMDDLLEKFKTHYEREQAVNVDALRPPYDLLFLKVLALLQDRDPTLANTILGSREAIWGMLADRERFISEI